MISLGTPTQTRPLQDVLAEHVAQVRASRAINCPVHHRRPDPGLEGARCICPDTTPEENR